MGEQIGGSDNERHEHAIKVQAELEIDSPLMPLGVRPPRGGCEQGGGLSLVESMFGGESFEAAGVGETETFS